MTIFFKIRSKLEQIGMQINMGQLLSGKNFKDTNVTSSWVCLGLQKDCNSTYFPVYMGFIEL